jgi:hypothetical protein
MPLDSSALPLLLAGPILRRVEVDLVSVWIATSRPCDVSMLLFDGADISATHSADDSRAGWASDVQPALQVGANLYVLTVVLDLRTPGGNAVRTHGATLEANRVFSYDLRIFDRQNPSVAQSLLSLGLLDGPVPLGYDPDELPSFKTCPADLGQLVLVHGSCRQLFAVPPVEDDPTLDEAPFEPPGGWPGRRPTPEEPAYARNPDEDAFPEDEYPQLPKRDGLLWVDTLVESLGPSRIAERPHQLFLTGDQIYADQPPAAVLPAINVLGRLLFGEEDLGADAAGTQFRRATLKNFPPAFRADLVRRSAGFTTSSGESHLLSFGEFVAYYLLTWSPSLWSLDLWPRMRDFDPEGSFVSEDQAQTLFDRTQVEMPEDWRVRFLFEDDRASGAFSPSYETLLAQLPVADSPPREASPDEHAAWYFEQQRNWAADRYWSPQLFEWWSRRFRNGLGRVRRALANVPTYMVADDHDISDDWNFSRQWREQVFTRPLGVDIVRNGMLAISVMQSWGNDPRRWAGGPERELLESIKGYGAAMAAAAADGQTLPRTQLDRMHELLGLPRTAVNSGLPRFRPLLEYSFQVEGPRHRVLAIDGRTKRRFPTRTAIAGGIDFEGPSGTLADELPTGLPGEGAAGLFGDSPMAAALPPPPPGDTKLTVVVTGVPVIGPEGMEQVLVPFQRFARLLGDVDAESWAYEPATYEALLAALSRYRSVVILSGDVHVGWSAALDYWSRPDNETVSTARIVQLVSSGLTKDWGDLASPLRNHALALDVFEAATTLASTHAERVGWGRPLRTLPVPVPLFESLITNAEHAHPFYRARLKMQAPVVPTHGWPEGAAETREPNWAWRAVMARDDREEATSPPSVQRRWTPVTLPSNPIDPSVVGWHASAARRMAYGRVFAVNTNVGIVTFEPEGDGFGVRHVLAGELPALADTGNVPLGLQPYIVHRFTLSPLMPESWNAVRPKVTADGGWGVDRTDPALLALLEVLPQWWSAAAGFAGAVWNDVPPVLDGIAREAFLSDAADRVSGSMRRRVLRDLGPFALLTDAQLDAVDAAAVTALAPAVGPLRVDREARALVRPDLERLLAFHQSLADPATLVDDVLLLGCSQWVNERARLITVLCGVLVTFRSPVTKHVPLVAGLLAGLWDLWRNRTRAEIFTDQAPPLLVAGLLAVIPRSFTFVLSLLQELIVNIIQDRQPRPGGGPPIFTPELALTALGVPLGLKLPRRFTLVSGWEPRAAPTAPGTRNGVRTPDVLARQTLSLMVHPEGTQRYVVPARKVSATLRPPPAPGEAPPSSEDPNLTDDDAPGSLVIGWDGDFEWERPIGSGFTARLELGGRATHEFAWSGLPVPQGRLGGASMRTTLLRPIRTRLGALGLELKITPALSLAIGVSGGPDEGSIEPALVLRLALNDREDRVTIVPDDAFLVQLLPTDGLALPFDAALEWSNDKGWRLTGVAQAANTTLVNPPAVAPSEEPAHDPASDLDDPPPRSALGPVAEVVTPMNLRLGLLSLTERRVEVTTSADDTGIALNLSAAASITLRLGPVALAVSGLGVTGRFALLNTFDDDDRLTDFSVGLRMPTGLVASIDTAAVTGGGFIERVEGPGGAVTWRGALDLRVGERVELTGFGIVETGGGRHWSLLALLIARFSPAIKLSAGLQLVALGGLIGLHRGMQVDALRDAATGTQGQLDSFMFPDRPEQRFLELMPQIDRFFPSAPGHQVIGLMALIEWGSTSQSGGAAASFTKFAEFRLALLADLESLQFGLYGTARFGLPSLDHPHALRLSAAAELLVDVRGGYVRGSLTLLDAYLFERVHLTGGVALLWKWSDPGAKVYTVGGFHPAYRAFIPGQIREPPRLGAQWKPHSLLDMSVQLYFAITDTSLQFGFAAHLQAGASWGGIRADTEFNFLVMTEPDFRFDTDLSMRVTAFLFGADLISASFSGSVSGPGPWKFEGSVYWEVCGVSISKDLGPIEWGDDSRTSTVVQEARQLIGDALSDAANWTIRRAPVMAVRLRPGLDGVIDPRDRIDVRQSRLPLGVAIDRNDANDLSDAGVWTLVPAAGLRKETDLTDVFPTRRYLRRPPKETPFRSGLLCGARLAGTPWTFTASAAVASDEEATEDLVLDSLPVRPRRVRLPVLVAIGDAVLVASPSRAPSRRWSRHAIGLEAVA